MVNDIHIATGIIGFMFFVAFLMPSLQTEFGFGVTNISQTSIDDNINPELTENIQTISSVKQLSIVGSIATMFFWTYTFLPAWVQLFFLVIRIVIILILAKYIPFVGGGG